MGLSDEERLNGIFWSINKMVEIADSIKDEKESYCYPKKLVDLVGQLWHAFLGKEQNPGHWILGSSATNVVKWDTCTSWGVAINNHCRDLFKEDDLCNNDFNAFDNFLDIPGLLRNVGKQFSAIYNVYAWGEQVIYYLRRYDDKLLKDLELLSAVISNIQGECFRLFKSNEEYARAYVLNAISKILYGDLYPYQKEKWDPFTKFLSEECGHHDLNRLMQPSEGDLKILAQMHMDLYKAKKKKKLTLLLRAEVFIKLAGRRFHYDHKFKKLLSHLKMKGASEKKLRDLFNQCKKDHEESEKKSMRPSGFGPLSIYGISQDIDLK